MERVLILDPGYQPINEVTVRKAIKLLFRERPNEKGRMMRVAEPVYNDAKPREEQSIIVRMAGSVFMVPRIIRLVHYIRRKMRHSVPLSKKNIMVRDNFECVYCGSKKDLTIDHVTPQSKGGKHSWDNMVTACIHCNQKKRDRTPNEARMYMKRQPIQPTISEHLHSRLRALGLDTVLDEFFGSV